MKFLKKLQPVFAYKSAILFSKISGFMFYSVKFKFTRGTIEFRRTTADYLTFVASFSYSFFSFFNVKQDGGGFQIKSKILEMGFGLLIFVMVASIMATKFMNMVWARTAFSSFRNTVEINNKVKLFCYLDY
jgi:hypothetical protein